VEWSRVSLNYQQASRTLGDLLHRAYQDTLGATRTAGLRNGPIDLLQGRQVPSVLISLGISPASGEVEIRRTADVIGNSLVSLKKG
jgi:N-acetylmuramoyl-L-alanine amidase